MGIALQNNNKSQKRKIFEHSKSGSLDLGRLLAHFRLVQLGSNSTMLVLSFFLLLLLLLLLLLVGAGCY